MNQPPRYLKQLRNWFGLLAVVVSLIGCASLDRVNRGTGVVRAEPQPIVTPEGQVALPEATAEILARAAGAQRDSNRQSFERLTNAVRRAIPGPLTSGNRVTPLIDGPAAFAAIDRAIKAAKSSVHVETYIFSNDDLGRSFADLLMNKASQGVEVRLIYDAIGSFDTPNDLFEQMKQAGVEVAEFRPLNVIKTLPWRYHNRDHRKLIVVDGTIAFTGGLNISGAYSAGSSSHPGPEKGLTAAWRDTHVQIEGPAVWQFQTIFFDTWDRLHDEPDPQGKRQSPKYFPSAQARGDDLVAAVTSNGVRQRDEDVYTTYLAAVTHASSRIWLTQAYFSPPTELTKALFAAVKRGVDVRVMLPGFTDSSAVFYSSRNSYDKYLRHGVRLYERTDALLHAKTALIDDSLVMIGSANLDYRSFLHNNEVTALIIGKDAAERMQSVFQSDLTNAHEITLEEWRKRSLGQRLKEHLSHLFNYWL